MPQPSTTGMVIPTNVDNSRFFENIDLNTSTIEAMLEKFFKFTYKDKLFIAQQVEAMTDYEKKISNYTKPNPAEEKKKKGLSKYFDKWFVKKDFLKTLGGFFKKLIDRAGGWLKTLLEVLLFFAIFDPKGKFLASIMNFIISMVEALMRAIIPWIPIIAKRMWNLFWDVLVPGFGRLGKMIGEQLFGADSALSGLFEWIGKLIPILTVILGVVSKLWPVLSFLLGPLFANIAAAWAASTGFLATAAALWAAVWPILAVVAGIVALVAAIYLIIKYWPKIKEIFFAVVDWFKNIGKIVGSAFKKFFNISGRFFKFIGKLFADVFKYIWKAIVKWFRGISFTSLIGSALKLAFFGLPGILVQGLMKIGPTLIGFVLKGLAKILPAGAFSKLLEIVNFIRGIFNTLSDYLTAFFTDPMAFINPLSDQSRRDAAMAASRISRLGKSEDVTASQLQVAGIGAQDAAKIKSGSLSTSQIAEIIAKSGQAAKAREQATKLDTATSVKWEKSFDAFKDKK